MPSAILKRSNRAAAKRWPSTKWSRIHPLHRTPQKALTEILSLSTVLLAHGLDDFDQLALPTQGNYRHTTIEGMSVVTFNEDVTRRQAQEFIYGSAQPAQE